MITGFENVLLAEFKTVFHDEEPRSLEQYLTGISRSILLQVGAYFLGFSNQKLAYGSYKTLLETFFCSENNAFANKVYDRLQNLEKQEQEKGRNPHLVIINPPSSLQLFEYGFEYLTEEETQSKAEIEVNLFKAYLLLNQQNTSKDVIAKRTTENLSKELYLPALIFAQSYPYSDLINYETTELITAQIIKSFYLFEFLAENDETRALLDSFLQYYACPDWEGYLKKLLPIVSSIIKADKEAHIDIVIPKDEMYKSNCEFIDKLAVKDNEAIQDYDFKIIRSQPIYKVSEGLYRIIYPLFVIEMIFKGLYFKLSEINNLLPKNVKKGNLRSFYCDEFSEKHLLYRLLNSIYKNRYIQFSGAEMLDAGLNAEPDFYIRKGNKAFLFESKDILINAEVKQSADYVLYLREFTKKLYYVDDGKSRKNKAVLQLIKNVKRLLEKNLIIDSNYKEKSLHIYPILILHDNQFNISGLNVIVNNWFQVELKELQREGLDTQRVKQLVIIDIDTLIFYQDLFRDRVLKLECLIDDYIKFITFDNKRRYRDEEHAKGYMKRTIVPFTVFLANLVGEKKIRKIPKMLMEKGVSLFR